MHAAAGASNITVEKEIETSGDGTDRGWYAGQPLAALGCTWMRSRNPRDPRGPTRIAHVHVLHVFSDTRAVPCPCSSFHRVHCRRCGTDVGRVYITTPPGLDIIRFNYSFSIPLVSRHAPALVAAHMLLAPTSLGPAQVGHAGKTHGPLQCPRFRLFSSPRAHSTQPVAI